MMPAYEGLGRSRPREETFLKESQGMAKIEHFACNPTAIAGIGFINPTFHIRWGVMGQANSLPPPLTCEFLE